MCPLSFHQDANQNIKFNKNQRSLGCVAGMFVSQRGLYTVFVKPDSGPQLQDLVSFVMIGKIL